MRLNSANNSQKIAQAAAPILDSRNSQKLQTRIGPRISYQAINKNMDPETAKNRYSKAFTLIEAYEGD